MLVYENFNTLDAYMNVIEREGREAHQNSGWQRGGGGSWTHYLWEEALQAGEMGSAWHRERVLEIKKRISETCPDATMSDATMIWDVAPGMGFDMGRAIEGEPEVWFDLQDKPTDELLVVVDGAYSAATHSERIERAGAAVAALVEVLQARGIGVTVKKAYGIVSDRHPWRQKVDTIADTSKRQAVAERLYGTKTGRSAVLSMITVQQPDSPMDLDALAYWLASSDAFRVQHFRHLDCLAEEAVRDIGTGLGYPINFEDVRWAFPEAQTMLSGKDYLYLSAEFTGTSEVFASDESAAEWLQTQITKHTKGEQADVFTEKGTSHER